MQFYDRLKFTTTGTSAASLSDGTAAAGCRNIARVISDTAGQSTALTTTTQNIAFTVEDGTGKWEDSLFNVGGTSAAPTLTRTQVLASSAGGTTAETFSGGTLTVFNSVPGKILSCIPIDTFPTTFSTTVPLTQIGTVHMPRQTVTGNLTFTAAAGAVKGAYAEYPLILDGTSTLTFTGFTEHGSSSGLLNQSGMPNTVWLWYDGYTYWWNASQAAVPVVIDTVAPTMSSASVVNATPATVTLTASEAMDSGYVPAASAFTISGHTVLAVTGVSGTSVTLSVSPSFANGESQSASYTQPGSNGLRDTSGNLMLSFTGLSVGNTVQPNANAVTLTGPTSGTSGVASSNFTAALSPVGSNFSGTCVVTPSDGGAGGTFAPTSLSLTQASPSGTFTYTASSTGAKTISLTNNSGLTNPSSITYTASSSDTTAPTYSASTAQVANASPTIVQFTMSETLANSIPPNSSLSITENGSAKTVNNVSINGAVVSVTCSAAFVNGSTIQLTYTQPGTNPRIQDATGNPTLTFGPITVTNNVSAVVNYPRLQSLSATTTESGTGPYTYTGGGTALASETGGISTLGATGDLTVDLVVLAAGSEVGFGLRTVQSGTAISNYIGGFYTSGGSGTVPAGYRHVGGANLGTTPQAGDVIRYSRTGSSATLSIQRNGTGAFTVIDTITGISTAKVYFGLDCCGTTSAQLMAWTGFA